MAQGGDASEDLVAEMCDRLFFRDFVVRNPRFRKASGREKEAADVLVLDDETLLAIQVKSKAMKDPRSDIELGRLTKTINHGIRQLNALRRALIAKQLTHVVTLRGIEIPLDTLSNPKLLGMVILDVIDEESHEPQNRPAVLAGLDFVGDTPAHVFLRSTFQHLASELDTLPDFISYLECRQALLERGILTPLTAELDFLALFKTNFPLVQQAVRGECDLLLISEGTWDDFVERGKAQRAKRTIANEPSYLIDRMIDFFHTALAAPAASSAQPSTPVITYFAVISELARMRRVERRVMGEKILEKLKAAVNKPYAFGVMADLSNDKAMLFLCTDKPREERLVALENMTRAAAHRAGVSRIIGIATEPEGTQERTFDAVIYRDLPTGEEDSAILEELAKKLFGPPKSFSRQEWE